METTEQEVEEDMVDMPSSIIETDQDGDLSQRDVSYSQSTVTVREYNRNFWVSQYNC